MVGGHWIGGGGGEGGGDTEQSSSGREGTFMMITAILLISRVCWTVSRKWKAADIRHTDLVIWKRFCAAICLTSMAGKQLMQLTNP